uniref:Uncharacterized protein n=1 Tax=Oryza nivara TaxID=4536 RepID=A0A0E0H8S3_ORYNI
MLDQEIRRPHRFPRTEVSSMIRILRRREAEELHPPSRTRKSASPVLEPLIQVRPSDDEEDRRRPRRLDNQRVKADTVGFHEQDKLPHQMSQL